MASRAAVVMVEATVGVRAEAGWVVAVRVAEMVVAKEEVTMVASEQCGQVVVSCWISHQH